MVNATVGRNVPYINNLPVAKGRMGDTVINVLRDTGCNTEIVRKDLVPHGSFTGKSSPVFLVDRTVKYLPEAEIYVETPLFTGKIIAKCMDNPLYDLILGNVEGALLTEGWTGLQSFLERHPKSTHPQLSASKGDDDQALLHADHGTSEEPCTTDRPTRGCGQAFTERSVTLSLPLLLI